jgi:hypothetical protein
MDAIYTHPNEFEEIAYSFFFLVFSPIDHQIGQKLTKLVSRKIAARARRIIPSTPVIICVKNKTAITTAISILTTLSIVPTFFSFSF